MSRTLRALLLAGGFGTRLKPITLQTPKCLVSVGGEVLLGRWLHQLEQAGVEGVLVNTHYLAEQVEAYVNSWQSPTMAVQTVYEEELLGTAGTLLANQAFFANATGLLIHADNVMAEGLRPFLDAHQNRAISCLMTMLTFVTDNPSSCGVVEIDKQNIVQRFHEKIANPPGNRANGALYAFEAPLLEFLNSMEKLPSDFSTEVIPRLIGRINTWNTDQAYLDVGTPEALEKAQKLFNPEP